MEGAQQIRNAEAARAMLEEQALRYDRETVDGWERWQICLKAWSRGVPWAVCHAIAATAVMGVTTHRDSDALIDLALTKAIDAS